jgi:hypothetical protein
MENAMFAFTARITRTHISHLPFFATSIDPVIFAGPLATSHSSITCTLSVNDHSLVVTPAAIAAVTRRLWLYPTDPLPDHAVELER